MQLIIAILVREASYQAGSAAKIHRYAGHRFACSFIADSAPDQSTGLTHIIEGGGEEIIPPIWHFQPLASPGHDPTKSRGDCRCLNADSGQAVTTDAGEPKSAVRTGGNDGRLAGQRTIPDLAERETLSFLQHCH